MSSPNRLNLVLCLSFLLLILSCSSACSSHSISSLFVAQGSTEIDMLNLVEAPPGHISGTFVVSALGQGGQRNRDVVHNVTGSLYQGNVSLQIDNGILEHPTTVVGNVSGSTLTLTFGNNPVVFHAMSQQEYAEALITLDKTAEINRQKTAARKAVLNLHAELNQLSDNLQAFVKWGNERIANVPGVQAWYAKRMAVYQRCLDRIRPLVAQQIPSWKWQSCVFAIDNDKYVREHESALIADAQSSEHKSELELNRRIANVDQQVAYAMSLMQPVCAVSKDPKTCMEEAAKYTRQVATETEKSKPVTEYRAMLPKIHNALDKVMQIQAEGRKRLATIASEVDRLYQSASQNPSD